MKILITFLLFLSSITITERVVSSSTTILNTDQIVRNVGGDVTFTMPTSPANGQEHKIINTGTGDITLSMPVIVGNGVGINKIPPYSSQILPGWGGGHKIDIYFNGTNWIAQ